jgi:hypothetical protein
MLLLLVSSLVAVVSSLKHAGSISLRTSSVASNSSNVTNKTADGYRQILHNFQNVQYYGDFMLGGQKIQGIFDTGSFELLVRSSRCKSCAHPTSPYDRSLSGTYEKNGTVAKHVFGSGPCISMKGYEEVSVGPFESQKQAFWEIMAHSIQALDTAKFAAIVGIGPNFAYGNTDRTLLMSFGVEEFSVCLQKASGSNGYLTWGPVAKPDYKDKHYARADVIGKHHWVARMRNVSFAPQAGVDASANEVSPCTQEGCAAIIDSGTSLIAAPAEALMRLSGQIPPILEDCSNLHELPDLHFNIDGTDFALPPEAYVMRITGAMLEADSIWDILFFKPKIRKVNMCMPGFMTIDMVSKNGPVWILGMPFFRYFHTTFDRERQTMHFAVAGPDCQPKPYKVNGTADTKALLAMSPGAPRQPMDIDVHAIVPPTLSEMADLSKSNMIDL